MGTKFSLKPLEDRLVVKPSEGEETTASGIVIPDTAKERPQEGEVMAIGPGRFEDGQRIPMDVKAGDRVVYSKYGGAEVKVRDEEYLILSAPGPIEHPTARRSAGTRPADARGPRPEAAVRLITSKEARCPSS
jgi:chaperonin GroES